MQALIDFIVSNLKAFWPIAMINEWEIAFMLRNGRVHRTLATGLHWRWLFVEKVFRAWSTEINVDLDNAAVVTIDGQPIVISANIGYKIVDLVQLWRTMSDSGTTIRQIAIGYLASECASREWESLSEQGDELRADLKTHLGDMLKDNGIEITRVQLTDLVPTRAYRLYGNTVKSLGNEGHEYE